jgi:hypothetical protein
MLNPQHIIDYAAVCASTPGDGSDGLVRHLKHELPARWRDAYIGTCNHLTNIVRFECGTFEYVCDLYTELECVGEIPFDQTVDDRVIGVLGFSVPSRVRRTTRQSGWIEGACAFNRDRGHFIAQRVGGALNAVFSQDRAFNRGWSEHGKLYRQMENYCYGHPGTFCFSRPIYFDETSVPRWLEFGLMRQDGTLWVELFEN